MRIEIRELAKNSLYLYVVQGLNYVLPLVTLPYLISVLSVDSFGKYSFALAISQFLMLFVDFGFNLSVTKKIAEDSENDEFVRDLFWRANFLKFAFFLISAFVSFVLISVSNKISYYEDGIKLSLIMVLGTALFPIWWFQGMNKMKILSFINVLSKALTFPFIFLCVKNKDDSSFAVLIQSLSIFVAGLISFVYIAFFHKRYFKNIRFFQNINLYKQEILDAWPIFLSNSSISLYTNSLTVLLGFISTSNNVGLFGAMERIVRVICFGILGPINQACFPILAGLKKTDIVKAKKIFKTVFFVTLLLVTFGFLTYLVGRKFLIERFMTGYENVEQILTIFMLMIFPIALGGVLGQLGLLALGGDEQKKIFSKIYIIVGLASIPLSLICIYLLALKGAVVSMMLVEFIIFIALYLTVRKFKFL